jgi:hypothetical protein
MIVFAGINGLGIDNRVSSKLHGSKMDRLESLMLNSRFLGPEVS